MNDCFARRTDLGPLRHGPGPWRKGAAAFILAALVPAAAARAAEFEITASSFTLDNQINASSVTYFGGMPTAPAAPSVTQLPNTPGGLYFDGTRYRVWDNPAGAWVSLTTGTANGSLPWSELTSFPGACTGGQVVAGVGPTLICTTPAGLLSGGTAGYYGKWTGGAAMGTGSLFDGGAGVTVIAGSTLTVTGNAFSVGGSTFVVTGGNVGIGTTSPATKLHLSSGTLTVDGNAAAGLQVFGSTFVVNSSGYVGVGTPSPAYPLDVQSAAGNVAANFVFNSVSTILGSAPGQMFGIKNTNATAGNFGTIMFRDANGNPQGQIGIMYGAHAAASQGTFFIEPKFPNVPSSFVVAPSGSVGIGTTTPAGLFTVGNGTMVVTAAGNVGIGTNAPGVSLDVKGAVYAENGTYNLSLFPALSRGGNGGGPALLSNTPAAGTLAIGTEGTGSISFYKNAENTSRLWIDGTSGNVGVGTTSPATKMHLSSGTLTVDGNASTGLQVFGSTFVVNSSGNVGIGTVSTSNRLTVSDGNILFNTPATSPNPSVAITWPSGSPNFRLTNISAVESVNVNSAGNTFFNGGNVGVGTASPATKLHMSSGTLTVDGNASTGLQVFGSTFVVNSSGNVGIGTTAPTEKLNLSGVNYIGMRVQNGTFYGRDNQEIGISGNLGTPYTTYLTNGYAGNMAFGGSNTGEWTWSTAPSGTAGAAVALTERMRITNAGFVGIGTAGPATALQVVGDVRVGTSGTNGCLQNFAGTALVGTCSSDARLKTNVRAVTGALEKVAALRPVSYEWKAAEFPERHFGRGVNYGLIAQEAEKVVPDLVQTDAQGYKAVSYGVELQMLTIEAIREQQAEIAALRAEIREFRKEREVRPR